jgi:hypothetical protein
MPSRVATDLGNEGENRIGDSHDQVTNELQLLQLVAIQASAWSRCFQLAVDDDAREIIRPSASNPASHADHLMVAFRAATATRYGQDLYCA